MTYNVSTYLFSLVWMCSHRLKPYWQRQQHANHLFLSSKVKKIKLKDLQLSH